MEILIKFILFKKERPDDEFIFWSCVLETSIDKESVDYAYLNKNNKYKIKDCDPFYLKIVYDEYSADKIIDIVKNHQKRPEFFLALDRIHSTGSPYSNSSSKVETYYQDTFYFIQQLSLFSRLDSDYKFNLLQRNTIKLIKKLIGLNIIKNGSTAGALSIYKKLPSFHVAGNFNSKNGERFITISPIGDLPDNNDHFVQIEITDNNKILFNTLQKMQNNFRYPLPKELEDFSQIHISVFQENKKENNTEKIYEERFNLFRSFRIKLSVTGSHSKIVNNRYLTNPTEKINIYDYIENISNNSKDFFDIEQKYKSMITGKKRKALESKFFNNTNYGRSAFLEWIRNILHGAKAVKIIDPFFDNFGLDDFISCYNTNFILTIITTDPKKRNISNEPLYKKSINKLIENIYSVFPECKIYFAPKFHDRYLFIDNGEKQKLYLFSNSWNGTVNHYSMYVHEIPFINALKIFDEINSYINYKCLQKPYTARPKKQSNNLRRKYSKKYLEKLSNNIDLITPDSDIQEIIDLTSGLFFTFYCGRSKKDFVLLKVRECLKKLPEEKNISIINNITEKLLIEQKKSFDDDNEYMDGKPFSWYDTPRKCYKRLSDLSIWGGSRSYNLNLNYGLLELLSVLFELYPLKVIEILLKCEREICVKKIPPTDNNLNYCVSEYIIQSFLIDYYPLDGKISEQAWVFINKTFSNMYIRMFFAVSIMEQALDHTKGETTNINSIIKIFSDLSLRQDEIAVVLGKTYSNINSRKQVPNILNPDFQNINSDFQEQILNYILEKSGVREIINFAFISFLEPYEIKNNENNENNDFKYFVQSLKKSEKNHEAETIEKIFLIYALQTNSKLYNKVCSLLDIEKNTISLLLEENELLDKKPSDIDVQKFIPSLRYLGKIFAGFIENLPEPSLFDKIIFSLPTDKTLIFNTKFPDKMTFFYYDLFFLLNTVFYLKKRNKGSLEILKFADWFLPVCIDILPNDFYGLGLKATGLFSILISEEEKDVLAKKLTYLPALALVKSTIKKQSADTIEIYKKYIRQYDIDGHNKSIPAENFLNIGISLCIRCTEECNKEIKNGILDCIEQINIKIKPLITDTAKLILEHGINYAKTLSENDKSTFLDSMKGKFPPYQAESLLED